MSYFAPYVDASGFHYPTYNELLEQLVTDMQQIYGAGIYLGSDSQDYQMISAIAEKIFDTYQAMEIILDARSPVTAIGTGLDQIVSLNGLARKAATKSTAQMLITGTSGTVITNGAVMDTNGQIWDLPAEVRIPSAGTVTCTAQCRVPGPVTADENTITQIMTPVAGWASATNTAPADPGTDTERDSALRARQAASVALPSRTVLAGLRAALLSLDNVVRANVAENDTGSTDANGIPAHSVCCIVDGGDPHEIAETIYRYKTPGCGTWGTSAETITDGTETYTVRYSPVTDVPLDIEVAIVSRTGYAASTPDSIKAALIDYLSGFAIGEPLSTSVLTAIVLGVNESMRQPTFTVTSVKAARHGETVSAADVAVDFDEAVSVTAANITILVS